MARDRAVIWMLVILLMTFGFLMNQAAAVMVAAMSGLVLVYEQVRNRPVGTSERLQQ